MFKPTADILRRVFAREKAPAPEVTVAKAKRYQELLDDPTFRELIEDYRIDQLKRWGESSVYDKAAHTDLRIMLSAADRLLVLAKKRVELGKIEVYKDKVATKITRFKQNITKGPVEWRG